MVKAIFLYLAIFFANLSYSNQDIFDIIDKEQIEELNNIEQEYIQEPTSKDSNLYNSEYTFDSDVINDDKNDFKFANIRVLNKILAKYDIVSLPIGQNIIVDNLLINAKTCFESKSKILSNDSKVLIEITSDNKLFNSWISAQNPSVSIFEHPIYNITLIGCAGKE